MKCKKPEPEESVRRPTLAETAALLQRVLRGGSRGMERGIALTVHHHWLNLL